MQIKAAVVGKDNTITIRPLELKGPQPHEVLVRIVAAGVCHTDLKCAGSNLLVKARPVVLGHEGAGIVEAVGTAVTELKAGDHVVMTFAYCGTCRSCREAEPAYCYQQYPLNFGCARPDGGSAYLCDEGGAAVHGDFFGQSSFATYAIGTERNVIKVPDDVPLEILGPLGCGIQTGAGAALNDLKVCPGDRFAVFGAGSLGLSAVMAARHAGAKTIIAVDRVQTRLDMALELGADHAIMATGPDVVAEILRITGDGVDQALDTTAVASVMRQAIDVLAPRGICGFVTAPSDGSELYLPVRSMLLGKKVRGIVEGNSNPKLFIPFLIDLYRQGRFPFDRLIRFYDFDEINEAFHAQHSGEAIKPVLRMG
ncbi:NAD(P)-dependent alcohol dehydrogenase [Neorhizobium sp. DT-125]|uniref:NAD(P)-dependent alcohol dehydrogenase n=1 Tax=Neorhizobium sp. DT-125 TaxID=3396163 RepID=UPI003F1AB17F